MINVMNVIDTGGPGGAETVFLNTSTGLDARSFRMTCVVSRDGWLANALRAKGCKPLIIPSSGSLNLRYLHRLIQVARDCKADVIMGHLYGSAIYCSLAGRLLGIPVISVLHGQSDVSSQERFSAAKRAIVRLGSTRAVFVSEQLKSALQSALKLRQEQCAIIPNGVEVESFRTADKRALRAELRLADDAVLVGAVGNIRKPKSYEVFLRAAKTLADRSESFRFVIAGEGSGQLYEDLIKLRDSLGLGDKVVFLGLRSDIPNILRSLDIYVLSSTTEGFSIACIEAMAAGTPVVATRSGGPEEIIDDEHSGLLVPVKDPDALANAVYKIASNVELSKKLVSGATTRVESRYTLAAMLDSYAQLLRSVSKKNMN
ncbi:MAG TPA: glycosyltransferase [Steroidobacteraceae bacterium]|nr:glycosyltransferase [Steroidobacteraceae bacterium]